MLLFGTSTVTTFVESASGVAEGGRTGLTSTGSSNPVWTVSASYLRSSLAIPSFATAPALIVVGLLNAYSCNLKIDFQ